MYFKELNANRDNVLVETKKRITMNLYRQKYGIPDDLMVRKADRDIRYAVEHSEAVDRIGSMLENSIHPSFLFFEKGMPEYRIQEVVKKLQRQGKSQQADLKN